MSIEKNPQYACLDLVCNDPPTAYCPLCGQKMLKDGELNPCKHLAFVHLSATGDIIFESDDFKKRLEAAGIDIHEYLYDNLVDFLRELGYDDSFLAISLTHGFAPSWYTDTFGFDYSKI